MVMGGGLVAGRGGRVGGGLEVGPRPPAKVVMRAGALLLGWDQEHKHVGG